MNRALAVALCLAAVPALAFEGVIETKMTINRQQDGRRPRGHPDLAERQRRHHGEGAQQQDGAADEHAGHGRREDGGHPPRG